MEVLGADEALCQALAGFNDSSAWLATHAERAVSRALGGSCSMPLAAHAEWQAGVLQLRALLGNPMNPAQPLVRAQASAAPADAAAAQRLGLQVAQALREAGGAAILAALG